MLLTKKQRKCLIRNKNICLMRYGSWKTWSGERSPAVTAPKSIYFFNKLSRIKHLDWTLEEWSIISDHYGYNVCSKLVLLYGIFS